MTTTQSAGPAPDLVPLDGTATPAWLRTEAVREVRTAEPMPFAGEEYEARLDRVRALLAERGADAVLVFKPSSVEYLCGYHSAETAPQPLLVTAAGLFLYVLDLELGRAVASSRADTVLYSGYATMDRVLELIAEHVRATLPERAALVIETGQASTPPTIIGRLRDVGVTVVDGDFLVERVRLRLSPAEIRCVSQAASVTQRGVDAAIAAANDPRATDASVAAAISAALLDGTDSRSAWGPVVAAAERGGIAHSSWLGRPLADGVTFLEFAGTHHRYHAPVMRTLVRGPVPDKARRLRDLARTALAAVLENARPGVTCSEVARAALAAIGPLRDDEVFHHMFGYPVGLAHAPHWMDGAPFYITTANHEPLQSGMVFHMPGSFRSFGAMGVGLSQTFLVAEDGTRPLTHGTADLIEVG